MELLAHVSAASSKKDDDVYKRQAHAYLGFEVANTILIPPYITGDTQEKQNAQPDEALTVIETVRPLVWSPSLFLDDTQLARTALESQLVTSSLQQEPQSSPHQTALATESSRNSRDGLLCFHTQQHPTGVDQASLDSSRSLVSSVSPGKRRHTPFVPMRGSAGSPVDYILPRQHRVSTRSPSKRQIPPSSSSGDDIPSQLPSTYSLSDVTSRSSHQQEIVPSPRHAVHHVSTPTMVLPRSNSDTFSHPQSAIFHAEQDRRRTTSTSSPPYQSGDARSSEALVSIGETTSLTCQFRETTDENTVALANRTNGGRWRTSDVLVWSKTEEHLVAVSKPSKADDFNPTSISSHSSVISFSREHADFDRAAYASSMRSSVRFATKMPTRAPPTPAKLEEHIMVTMLSTSIFPGPPTTSSKAFISHVTPDLEKLYNNPDLSCCYRPKQIIRSVRQSERGHWLIDTCAWSAALQIAFWNFLERQVGCAKAGWGVWCTREPCHSHCDGNSAVKDTGPCLGIVKVFCWGEILQHVYMMLFVASKSRIKRDAPVWADAEGNVVVRM